MHFNCWITLHHWKKDWFLLRKIKDFNACLKANIFFQYSFTVAYCSVSQPIYFEAPATRAGDRPVPPQIHQNIKIMANKLLNKAHIQKLLSAYPLSVMWYFVFTLEFAQIVSLRTWPESRQRTGAPQPTCSPSLQGAPQVGSHCHIVYVFILLFV